MHIRKHGDGYRVIVQRDGKQRSAVVPNWGEANRVGSIMYLEMGGTVSHSTMTVGEMIATHLANARHAKTTADDYASVARHVPDWMNNWLVADVTAQHIYDGYQRLTALGWTDHRIVKLHNIFSPAFALAAKLGWIKQTPILTGHLSSKPVTPRPQLEVPTPDEVRTLIAKADELNPALGVALRLAASGGLRRGELTALQWSDLDAVGDLHIRRAQSSTKGNAHHIKDTKTGDERRIGLDAGMLAALEAHRKRQATGVLARPGASRSPWIFSYDDDQPWRTDYVTKMFDEVRIDCDLEHVQLKNLRHFMATQMLAAGVDIRTVAGRLGHDPKVCLSRYAAFIPARDRDAADFMGRLLG